MISKDFQNLFLHRILREIIVKLAASRHMLSSPNKTETLKAANRKLS